MGGPGPGGTDGDEGPDTSGTDIGKRPVPGDEGPGPGGTDGGGDETGPFDVVSGRFDLLLLLNCERRHRAVLSPRAGESSVSVAPTLNSSRTASGTEATTAGGRGSVGVLSADGDGRSPSWTELAAVTWSPRQRNDDVIRADLDATSSSNGDDASLAVCML